jgi:DNA repair photolyase
VVLTRARRILDDTDLLRRSGALVGLSIPTDADEYRQIFEPDADPIEERLEALRILHAAGVRTFAVIQPVLPMNIERLVDAIAPFARAVRIDGMHVTPRAMALYEQHGLEQYSTKEFANETIRALTRAFKERGVKV